MRYGNLAWAIPATFAIAGIWAVSACANWYFGGSLGDDSAVFGSLTTAQLFSGASLASDVLKTVMLFGAAWALATRHWMAASVMATIWVACVLWSVASAVGFVALNNGTVTDRRGKSADEWSQLRKEIERTQERREWVPKHRPSDTVRAELAGIEANYLFSRTRSCTDVTAADSTELCRKFADLKQEIGNADAAAKLDDKLHELRGELKGTDRVTSANPFSDMVGAFFGATASKITTVQAIFLALLLELISGPGFWAVWSAALAPARASQKPERSSGITVATQPVPAVLSQPEAFAPPSEPETVPVSPPEAKPSPKKEAETVTQKYPVLVTEDQRFSPKPKPRSKAERNEAVDVITKRWMEAGRVAQVPLARGDTGKALYGNYAEWCGAVRIAPVNDSHFGRSIRRLKVGAGKGAHGATYALKIVGRKAEVA